MDRVLRKRLLRDLKQNFGRYAALMVLIVMGIFLVISMVDAAEVIIGGTEDMREVSMTQDGSFTVFLPLTEEEKEKLSEGGTVIEEMFYLDLPAGEDRVLRLYKDRENIDLVQLDEGRSAQKTGEAVIEKRYAAENGLDLGDRITAGGVDFTLVGIGSVPDYDNPLQKMGDTAAQSKSFGLLFVTGEQYEKVRTETVQKAEEYSYGYRLGKNVSDDDLKNSIKDLEFDYTKVDNKYFRQTIDEILGDRDEIKDGVAELSDGTGELYDGMEELSGHSDELREAADELFEGYLSQAQASIDSSGMLKALMGKTVLTKDNYREELDKLIKDTGSEDLSDLKESLASIEDFRQGIYDYTDGVGEAYEGSGELKDGVEEMQENVDELLDKISDIDIDNLTAFTARKDDPRIEAAADDVQTNKVAGLAAGVIVLILFAYVISVFVVHQIEKESGVIGALYALGVKKKDLLRHYVALPSAVALAGGLAGFGLALTPMGIRSKMSDSYGYFSIPVYPMRIPAYLIVYALVLPPLISALVNALVINKKLSQTALSLIKNEQKASSYRQFRIKTRSFPRMFQIRQMVREIRSSVTMVMGMFLSLLIVMLGIQIYVFCENVRIHNIEDTRYEYMYLYKYPESEVPAGGEGAYIESLSTGLTGSPLEVMVIGLDGKSSYFDAVPEKGKTKAVINDSLHERLGLDKGSKVSFSDNASDSIYTFTVTGICDYSPGFTIFMDIGSMRELFGRDEDYFNAVFSDKDLHIDEGRLYSITTKADVEKSAKVFIEQMHSLIYTLFVVGAVIFCIVMYLMMGVTVDRASFGISLIKIFGYRSKEVRKLYLNGNLIIIAAAGLICIPAAKAVIEAIYPSMVANVACCMKTDLTPSVFLLLYSALLLIYVVINELLVFKIKKITPAEVLKNRE
ncbi:MAG: ABC transporter permease [Ruminococcus sp.]|nr:ABC transporter permease [Ruminococcus sp.]